MSDVAEVAGVSHQTVSRVLNDHPSVRPETRERVLAAISELGYRRNSAARALVTRRSGTIGVVTTGSLLYGPTSTLVGLEEAARDAGYFVSVATISGFDAATMHSALEHFMGQGVEGIVIIAPQVEVMQAVEEFDAPVPVVMISSGDQPEAVRLHTVSVDQVDGARQVTRHLLAAGRGDVAHVAGPQDWFDAQDRLAGWRAECAAAGVAAPDPIEADWTAERGYAVGRAMVREGAPSAVFAANDQLALGLLRAFWEGGLRLPQDVAVAGFDDVAGSAFFVPPLTTVRQDFAALGRLTIEALTAALEGRSVTRHTLPAQLVVRASSWLSDAAGEGAG